MNKTKQASDIEFPTNPFLQFEWELNKLIKKYEKKEEASIRGYFVLVGKNASDDNGNMILGANILPNKIYSSLRNLVEEANTVGCNVIEDNLPVVYGRSEEEIVELEQE